MRKRLARLMRQTADRLDPPLKFDGVWITPYSSSGGCNATVTWTNAGGR